MVKKKNESFLDQLNKSKLFAGLAMLMLNIGSKYIVIELSPNQESYFRNIRLNVYNPVMKKIKRYI